MGHLASRSPSAWGIHVGRFCWAVTQAVPPEYRCWHGIGAPIIWVTFELSARILPEISFPWNLDRLFPRPRIWFSLRFTTITGSTELSFLVACFKAACLWTSESNTLTISAGGAPVRARNGDPLEKPELAGPRLVHSAQAHHFARAVQPHFPGRGIVPADWFSGERRDLGRNRRISLAPARKKKKQTFSSGPKNPASFSFPPSKIRSSAKLPRRWRYRFGHPFLSGASMESTGATHRSGRPLAVL